MHIEPARWRRAIEDGERFLAEWGDQAAALGWDVADLFGLHTPPANPHPSYSKLSRYATITTPTGGTLSYRRFNKPGLGPLGDSLDDFAP